MQNQPLAAKRVRFSRRIGNRLTLAAMLLMASAQAQAVSSQLTLTTQMDLTPGHQAVLETALSNTGAAVDNLVNLGLAPTLGGVGQSLDGVAAPVVSQVTGVTQQVGAATGLGGAVSGLTGNLGETVTALGDRVQDINLPLGLGQGVGGLVSETGRAVGSAGGLLDAKTAKGGQPVAQVLNHTTQGVGELTGNLATGGLLNLGGLTGGQAEGGLLAPVTGLVGGLLGGEGGAGGGEGGLLAPVTGLVGGLLGGGGEGGLLGGLLGGDGGLIGGIGGGEAAPILVTALGNTGQALDNVLPLGLSPTLASVGETLDGVVSPVLGTVTGLTQQLGGATGLGATVDGVTTQLGGVVSSLGDQLGGTLPIAGVGGLVSGLGDTVSSVGALLNPNHPDAGNPLGAILGNATGAVASLTEGLGLGGLGLGGEGGAEGGLLSPVTGLVGGLLGGLGGQPASGGEAGQPNGGLLAPVTGLVGGLLGGLTGGLGGAR